MPGPCLPASLCPRLHRGARQPWGYSRSCTPPELARLPLPHAHKAHRAHSTPKLDTEQKQVWDKPGDKLAIGHWAFSQEGSKECRKITHSLSPPCHSPIAQSGLLGCCWASGLRSGSLGFAWKFLGPGPSFAY